MPKARKLTPHHSLSNAIVQELSKRASRPSKEWFTNYVKGTEWLGCKVPIVRQAVKDTIEAQTIKKDDNSLVLADTAIQLLQRPECDIKLAGMLLLQEHTPKAEWTTHAMLNRFDTEIWNDPTFISDWSTADWFAMRVLQPVAYTEHSLSRRILDYTKTGTTLWQRRCGVVTFVHYYKNRSKLPEPFPIVAACEQSLQASPEERFTQTGVAWILRYALLQEDEQDDALKMIVRNQKLWTTEAKKSLVEKLSKQDKRRRQILEL